MLIRIRINKRGSLKLNIIIYPFLVPDEFDKLIFSTTTKTKYGKA